MKFSQAISSFLWDKRMSQKDFADKTEYHKTQVSKWINGRNEPNTQTIERILKHFPDFKKYLDSEEPEKEVVNNVANEPKPLFNKNGNEFHELSDGTFDIKVKLLPFPAYASYLESMESTTEEQMERDMETVVFNVEKFGRGHYMAFIVKNDSMDGGKINDTPGGAKVLGRELQKHHWKDGFHESKYGWIIMCKMNIYHKDISSFNSETGEIMCSSRNPSPEYSNDFPLNLNNVYKIFKVIKRIF